MKTIENDWAKHTWALAVGGSEYSVECWVYLTTKEIPDEYSRTGRDTQVASWNLETWAPLPPCLNAAHEKEIERQLLQRLEEEYGQT